MFLLFINYDNRHFLWRILFILTFIDIFLNAYYNIINSRHFYIS